MQGLAEEQVPAGGQRSSPVQAWLQLLPGQTPGISPSPQGFTPILLRVQHPQHVLGPQGPQGVEHGKETGTEKAALSRGRVWVPQVPISDVRKRHISGKEARAPAWSSSLNLAAGGWLICGDRKYSSTCTGKQFREGGAAALPPFPGYSTKSQSLSEAGIWSCPGRYKDKSGCSELLQAPGMVRGGVGAALGQELGRMSLKAAATLAAEAHRGPSGHQPYRMPVFWKNLLQDMLRYVPAPCLWRERKKESGLQRPQEGVMDSKARGSGAAQEGTGRGTGAKRQANSETQSQALEPRRSCPRCLELGAESWL